MSNSEPRESAGRRLSTADLAAAGRQDMSAETEEDSGRETDENLGPETDEYQVSSEIQPDDRPTGADSPEETDRESAVAARPAEVLEPLFTSDAADSYRGQWTSIQSGFVDDPRQAVRDGDELVAEVMTNLANTFADERSRVEAQLDGTGEGATEDLRVALRRYRSFFERLLSL
jgi:hypothetical protein